MEIAPSPDVTGAEIYGVELAHPLPDAEFGRIEAAFNRHAVLCFRSQKVDEPQLIAFARRFGAVERIFFTHYAYPTYPEIMLVSNIKGSGRDTHFKALIMGTIDRGPSSNGGGAHRRMRFTQPQVRAAAR
jgi:alpha-ketoglutarate-dependent taurine dioxygenase